MAKPKTCPECGDLFQKERMGQKTCRKYECAISFGRKMQEKAKVQEEKAKRKETKARLEKLKTRSEWVEEAEQAARSYRRLYELHIGSGCISCGKTKEEVEAEQGWKPGGAWDGGHYLGKGARPELRLEPVNIWLQCKSCNSGSYKYARKGETVAKGYRLGLIDRIGLEAVEALEADHRPRKYTIDDLREIRDTYRAKVRALKKLD